MDTFPLTKAAAYINVSRQTLGRMGKTGVLPPDGTSGAGRKYWLKQTLDAYRLANTRTASVATVDSSLLPELSITSKKQAVLLGHKCVPVPLTVSSRSEAISELFAFVVNTKPVAIALPASSPVHPLTQATIDVCHGVGVCVLLVP